MNPHSFCRLLAKPVLFFVSLSCQAQAPLWVFTPLSPTNLTLTKETSATVQYNLSNQSTKRHTLVMQPIVGVEQITTPGNCSNPLSLASQESCTLTLQLRGATLVKNIFAGPRFCEMANSLQCYQPSQANSLNITLSAGNFLVITDIHLDKDATNITYGEDTGTVLFSRTLAELALLLNEQRPPFILFLGDSPAHSEMNRDQNIQLVLQGLSGEVTNTPLFYVYANNDSYNLGPNPTANYGPFSENGVNLFNLDPSASWPALNVTGCPAGTACINPETSPDMFYVQKYGFYSAYPLGSYTPLRFIAVNSVIFSYRYTPSLAIQQQEAQLEFDWLAAQLEDARIKNEQVYIAMHIPVGDASNNNQHPDFWNTSIVLNGDQTPSLEGLTLRNAFLRLAADYKQTIQALITGHTHKEEYRFLYSGTASAQPTVLDVGVPAITPQHTNNPGMQVFYHDATFQLLDTLTYYTTPEALSWLSFNFRNDYACPPGSTMFSCLLTRLIPNLRSPESSVIGQYEANFSVRSPVFNPEPATTWARILKTIQVYPAA